MPGKEPFDIFLPTAERAGWESLFRQAELRVVAISQNGDFYLAERLVFTVFNQLQFPYNKKGDAL
jgi:hypothetical protein